MTKGLAEPALWSFVTAIPSAERVMAMELATPPAAMLANADEIDRYLHGPVNTLPAAPENGVILPVSAPNWSTMPTPKLNITDDAFRFDYFNLGLYIVSDRLARTLALGPDEAQYIEVDCIDCAEQVQDMGYKVINPLAYANPLDRDRTGPGAFVDLESPNGPTYAWVRSPWHPNTPPPRIAWRADFWPPAPLFRVPGESWILTTDELAERVMRGGFEDVSFLDLTNDGTRAEKLIFRRLDRTA